MVKSEGRKQLAEQLKIYKRPILDQPSMVLGFGGWMDGGEVSTGTLEYLIDKLDVEQIGAIEPGCFYIYNFPGSMELSSLFRPQVTLHEGQVVEYREPINVFYGSERDNVILMVGKEPNMHWQEYADCIFAMAEEFGVRRMCFIGSVAGLVPHTREPRLSGTVSDESLKGLLTEQNIKFSNYSGPGSIVNLFMRTAKKKGIEMVSLVAEIPAYVHGRNPKCIEAVVKRLGGLANLDLNVEDLRRISEALEKKLDGLVAEREELGNHIHMLEENYDKELFDTEMGDLKDWLKQQGLRVD